MAIIYTAESVHSLTDDELRQAYKNEMTSNTEAHKNNMAVLENEILSRGKQDMVIIP